METNSWKVRVSVKGTFVQLAANDFGVPTEVCRVYNCSRRMERAYLLAASPRLYAALEEALRELSLCGYEADPLMDRGRAALAAARGEG